VNIKDSDWLQHLQELLLKDLDPGGVSGITQRAFDKRQSEGSTGVNLASAHLQFPDLLELGFEVESSFGDTGQMTVSGQRIGGYDPHYMCYLQFSGLDRVMGNDFLSLPRNAQKRVLLKVFDDCDVKVNCNCPAWYFQGHAEDMAKKGGAIVSFRGTKGQGIWRRRHQASGGLTDPRVRVCKHLYQVAEEISSWIPEIINTLKGQGAPTVSESISPQIPEAKPKNAREPKVEPKASEPQETETKADAVAAATKPQEQSSSEELTKEFEQISTEDDVKPEDAIEAISDEAPEKPLDEDEEDLDEPLEEE
jgi:hypothetical protein